MFGKDAIVISLKLFIITAVAALCLATANKMTFDTIQENAIKTEQEALREVLPAGEKFESTEGSAVAVEGVTVEKVNVAMAGDKVVGFVVTAVSNAGYGGDIKVVVGIDKDLAVTKVKILESSETAGLGANASKPSFIDQFNGAKEILTVVKGAASENQISAISSATITSKAVTACVNAALEVAGEKVNSGSTEKIEETVKAEEEIKQQTKEQIEGGAR